MSSGLYYFHNDHLGSPWLITNASKTEVQRLSYDAWGRRRDANNWSNYSNLPAMKFDRGYTGHEHLDMFDLINMNARLYDPVLGRFLSADPYVQAPDFSQAYNRYSYAMNNPMMYVDPDGEFVHLIIGAVIGGAMNLIANWGNVDNVWQGLGYFGVGAAAGALSAGVGAGISSAMAGSSFSSGFFTASNSVTSSFISGAAIGGGAGFSGGFSVGLGNGLMQGNSLFNSLGSGVINGVIGGASGSLFGGLYGGIDALRDGRNFMHGGRLIEDVSMPLPQMNQVGELDCRYDTFRSFDEYFNGSTQDVSSLRMQYPNAEVNDRMLGRMYSSKKLALKDLIAHNEIKPELTSSDNANVIVGYLKQNTGVSYEMSVKKGFAHAVAINRVRIYDNGRIIMNFMNPSSTGGGSISNFNNMRKVFAVISF